MGIKGLYKFLCDYAPKSIKECSYSSFIGQVIAIDASMSLYQFLIAIRDNSGVGSGGFAGFNNLTNAAGDTTSHIAGMLSRTVRLMENGIKPVYVFDGVPPTLKSGELAKRKDKREQASQLLNQAKETGDLEEMRKQSSRVVHVTKQQNKDIMDLLRLIGVPCIEAPCEAEAQCAIMSKHGIISGVATEDADALTFGSKVLIKNLNFSESKAKQNPVLAVNLQTALEELKLTMDEFVDFCILCGCDYCDTIKGIGNKTAYNLILEHKSIDNIIKKIDQKKHPLPPIFPYQQAREFFANPVVLEAEGIKLEWKEPDEEGLCKFLIDDNSFNPTRVHSYITRLKKAKGKSSQMRLDNFFGAATVKSSTAVKENPQTVRAVKKALKTSSTSTPNGGNGAKDSSSGNDVRTRSAPKTVKPKANAKSNSVSGKRKPIVFVTKRNSTPATTTTASAATTDETASSSAHNSSAKRLREEGDVEEEDSGVAKTEHYGECEHADSRNQVDESDRDDNADDDEGEADDEEERKVTAFSGSSSNGTNSSTSTSNDTEEGDFRSSSSSSRGSSTSSTKGLACTKDQEDSDYFKLGSKPNANTNKTADASVTTTTNTTSSNGNSGSNNSHSRSCSNERNDSDENTDGNGDDEYRTKAKTKENHVKGNDGCKKFELLNKCINISHRSEPINQQIHM